MLTRERIVIMAGEAGFNVGKDDAGKYIVPQFKDSVGTLERFANLVIADFLERTGQYVTTDASREAALAQAKAEEREACAKVCDGFDHPNWDFLEGASLCAKAIRARGEKGGAA